MYRLEIICFSFDDGCMAVKNICALPEIAPPEHFHLRISATSRFILGTVAFDPVRLHLRIMTNNGTS